MTYKKEEILKASQIVEELERIATDAKAMYDDEVHKLNDSGYHSYLYVGTILNLEEICENIIRFNTSDTCCGCTDYDSISLPMEFFTAENLQKAMEDYVTKQYNEYLAKKELERIEKNKKETEIRHTRERLDYEQYLHLKEKYEGC